MKRMLAILSLITVFAVQTARADGISKINEFPLHVEASFGIGTNSNHVMPFGEVIDLNYHFTRRFSIRAVCTSDFFLQKNGASKDYNNALNLGGGIGYAFDLSDKFVWEARAFVTTTLNSCEFKNISYNVGLYLYGKTQNHKIVPLIGLGYNLKDYRVNGLSSYNGAYITLGIRF